MAISDLEPALSQYIRKQIPRSHKNQVSGYLRLIGDSYLEIFHSAKSVFLCQLGETPFSLLRGFVKRVRTLR